MSATTCSSLYTGTTTSTSGGVPLGGTAFSFMWTASARAVSPALEEDWEMPESPDSGSSQASLTVASGRSPMLLPWTDLHRHDAG